MKIINFTLLIIFILGINLFCFSQEIKLKILAKDSLENVALSKINYNRKKLKEYLIQNELDSIFKSIYSLGYLNAEIISKTKKDSTYFTEFKLNNQVKMVSINFSEDYLLEEFIRDHKLQVNNNNQITIKFNRIPDFLKGISLFYKKKGHPFVSIKLANHQIENDKLVTELVIQKKTSRKIDRLIIKGYEKFSSKYLNHYLKHTTNKTFNKTNLTRLTTKINSVPFITQLKEPEVLFLKDSTLIYVYLQKKKTSQFDGLIGFSSNDKSKIVFNGHLNLKLNNVFNKGELIKILWRNNEKETKYFNLSLDLPYIFNSRINPKINFSIYSQDSSFVNIQAKTTLNYILNNKHKIGLISSIENSNNLLKDEVQDIMDYKTNLYGIEYNYKINSTNIFYKNKQSLTFIIKHGVKNTNNDKINKTEIQLNLSYLIKLNKKLNINLNNYSAINISDDILKNELYKIGGTNSIRGFLDKSITSAKYSILTTDISYKINKKTYIYSIIDYGQTYNKKFNSLISLGLGYKTKLKSSILNINYSIGKAQENSFDMKKALLNISFINYF